MCSFIWLSNIPLYICTSLWASLVAQRLKLLPPMRETQVRSLGWEDPLEKEMVTHSSILAWRIPWTEEPGRLQSIGSKRVGHDWVTSHSLCVVLNEDWNFKSAHRSVLGYYLIKLEVLVTQLCMTLCNPRDCSPPGSSVHGISQARILEWVAIPFSRGSIFCNNLRERIWKKKKMVIGICITEPLCCTSEMNTTLSINYTPV